MHEVIIGNKLLLGEIVCKIFNMKSNVTNNTKKRFTLKKKNIHITV